jgi:1,4-alpha-glucan branching enzyme
MIKRAKDKVTFTLPRTGHRTVSVVGDFNGWDPEAHRLKQRSNGMLSVAVPLPPGTYRFRYLADGGIYFDDENADWHEPNEHGSTNGVLVVG